VNTLHKGDGGGGDDDDDDDDNNNNNNNNKFKNQLSPSYTMKANGSVEVKLQSFLTSAPDRCEGW
jgi:hypothetical protein